MVREENRALFEQLSAEVRSITTEIDTLQAARTNLANSRDRIRDRFRSYRDLRTNIQSRTLTRSIRSEGEFQGGCANGLRDRHRDTRTLLDGREERIRTIISAIDSQRTLLSTRISELNTRRNNIRSRISGL